MPRVSIVSDLPTERSREIASRIKDGIRSLYDIEIIEMNIYNVDINTLINSSAIIFGCPTSMGAPSALFKGFMEETRGEFYNQTFKNKLAAGFTFGDANSGDKHSTLQTLCSFASQHSMLWISQGHLAENEGAAANAMINENRSYLGNITEIPLNNQGHANNEPHINNLQTAYYFGKRIGDIVNTWV
jgi:NAD(P)H dehydrogenase (quinone)